MPTPRKPLEHHKAAGTLRPRHRDGGPPVCRDPIGPAPAHFGAKLCAVWDEIVGLLPAGVAARQDRLTLELCAVLLARFRLAPETMRAAEINQLRSTLAALGMTPQGRALLVVAPEEPDPSDPAAKFFDRQRGK